MKGARRVWLHRGSPELVAPGHRLRFAASPSDSPRHNRPSTSTRAEARPHVDIQQEPTAPVRIRPQPPPSDSWCPHRLAQKPSIATSCSARAAAAYARPLTRAARSCARSTPPVPSARTPPASFRACASALLLHPRQRRPRAPPCAARQLPLGSRACQSPRCRLALRRELPTHAVACAALGSTPGCPARHRSPSLPRLPRARAPQPPAPARHLPSRTRPRPPGAALPSACSDPRQPKGIR
ncbi:proline-rich receptor-like protein kinase PERK9 [Panicum hallii]|uniref:proline-rich receptor-like protein kinase PERK9 n=1 Tax=Panicum hallii TaxID=206008 RepID=UPI000DF4EA5A|nr:proline-rich receptor-like protein kinase PERK9 [Panicum hallii]